MIVLLSFALFIKAKSFLAHPARIFQLVGMYLHVGGQVTFVGTFFIASLVGAFPFLTVCV